MNSYTTIHELIGHAKGKIEELNKIVDVLLSEYRTGAEIIDSVDHRKKPLEQLQELNHALSDIVSLHPVSKASGASIQQHNAQLMKEIAESEINIYGSNVAPGGWRRIDK